MTLSLADAKDIHVDAAVATVFFSELDGTSAFKEEQRIAPKAFLSGRDVFTLVLTGFGKNFLKH